MCAVKKCPSERNRRKFVSKHEFPEGLNCSVGLTLCPASCCPVLTCAGGQGALLPRMGEAPQGRGPGTCWSLALAHCAEPRTLPEGGCHPLRQPPGSRHCIKPSPGVLSCFPIGNRRLAPLPGESLAKFPLTPAARGWDPESVILFS